MKSIIFALLIILSADCFSQPVSGVPIMRGGSDGVIIGVSYGDWEYKRDLLEYQGGEVDRIFSAKTNIADENTLEVMVSITEDGEKGGFINLQGFHTASFCLDNVENDEIPLKTIFSGKTYNLLSECQGRLDGIFFRGKSFETLREILTKSKNNQTLTFEINDKTKIRFSLNGASRTIKFLFSEAGKYYYQVKERAK
jgi:hypothetical protein